jgi:hypothetical protein
MGNKPTVGEETYGGAGHFDVVRTTMTIMLDYAKPGRANDAD